MPRRALSYFLIHKPFGVLSQFTDEAGHPGLATLFNLPKDVYPVGRLDRDSEGLLILTNDKSLNRRLLSPTHQHRRTYLVEVDGNPEYKTLVQLSKGVEINLKGRKYETLPCGAEKLDAFELPERDPPVNRKKHAVTSWIRLTLTEGKNRQIRKMTAKVGHPTLRLIRVAVEDVHIGPLHPGQIVQISGKVLYKKLFNV